MAFNEKQIPPASTPFVERTTYRISGRWHRYLLDLSNALEGTLLAANNLSDVADAATSLSNIGGSPSGGSTSITTLGTVTTGTWNATPIDLANYVSGDLPFANLTQIAGYSVLGVTGASTADVAAITASLDGQVLRREGGSVSFGAVNVADGDAVTGILTVSNGGTSRASHTAYAVICGGTTSTGVQQSIASVGTSGQVLTSNGAGALPTMQDNASVSVVAQQVRAVLSTTSGTTTIPLDNTIPQNTEGTEVGTVSITPTDASSVLVIEAHFALVSNSVAATFIAALFVDSTADALNTGSFTVPGAQYHNTLSIRHYVSAASTSARTYKIRVGSNSGTWYTGQTGTVSLGSAPVNILTVTEYTS